MSPEQDERRFARYPSLRGKSVLVTGGTERQRALWVDEDTGRLISESQSLPARVMPDDLARAALFLASDDAATITQQALIVDGGWV